jgi:hypothetical protein
MDCRIKSGNDDCSNFAPVIGFLFVVEVPDAGDMRGVALLLRPVDRFFLRFEGLEHVVGMIFDHIIIDMLALGAALGARLNVHVWHAILSLNCLLAQMFLLLNPEYSEMHVGQGAKLIVRALLRSPPYDFPSRIERNVTE